jgi:2-polyprenyl-3-methyl-5-hydroxy-6-metoxy-1,4-benzoquinol methylase
MSTQPAAADLNREIYDRRAAGFDDYWRLMAAPRFRRRTLLDLLAAQPPASLVELGCGDGSLLAEIHRRLPRVELAGVDLAGELIDANRERWPEVRWVVADLDAAGAVAAELRGRFAAVVASEVVEHVDQPETFLRNARDLAAPGARLLLSTQSGPLRQTEQRVGHRRHFSAAAMSALLRAAGWEPVRVWNAGYPFHDLSKWAANLRADATLERFGERSYGLGERAVCAALRLLFRFNSQRRGAQLFAEARREGSP